MKQVALREALVQKAEESFISLTSQLDHLFNLVGFYLDRYPAGGTLGSVIKTQELKETVDNLASLISQLAEVVSRWKEGHERVLSRTGTEISVLNEISANSQALIYFLMRHDIDIEPFDLAVANTDFIILKRCNSLLT